MSTVKVAYYGLVKNIVGISEEEIVLGKETRLRELLNTLTEKHGDSLRFSLLNTRGELRPLARIMLNGESLEDTGGLDAILKPDQNVSIFLMVAPAEGG